MSNGSSQLILRQMSTRLSELFKGRINLNDISGSESDREHQFTTRAYMALFFLEECNISADEAAECITDGGDDDGIDAVYVDQARSKIYLGQSKWRLNMNKGVDLAEFTRFRDGVENIIMQNWNKANRNLHKFRDLIDKQLNDINTEIVMVLAHNSDQALSREINIKLSDFLNKMNKHSDLISFREFKLEEATRIARSYMRPENIDLQILLNNWGMFHEPYRAVFGSVAGSDLADWFSCHGNKLFSENLRYGIDKSEVNEGIINTAQNSGRNFWYYNNGITAICDDFQKTAAGGSDNSSGIFDARRISIINGAQTISSLFKANQSGADLKNVRVHLRIISLKETPEDFAVNVTSANNRQNDLNAVDFVAIDPVQDRIRRDLARIGVTYSFRRGDAEPDVLSGCTIRAATIAAACASGDLRLAVSAKRYISGLWENTRKDPYIRLFNSETDAKLVWQSVQVMHAVDNVLGAFGDEAGGRERLICTHGNRFILFVVFEKLNKLSKDNRRDVKQAEKLVPVVARTVIQCVQEILPDAYPGNIFKNQERQEDILQRVRSALSTDVFG